MNDKTEKAKKLFLNIIGFDSDNAVEIDDIVENIVEGILEILEESEQEWLMKKSTKKR